MYQLGVRPAVWCRSECMGYL